MREDLKKFFLIIATFILCICSVNGYSNNTIEEECFQLLKKYSKEFQIGKIPFESFEDFKKNATFYYTRSFIFPRSLNFPNLFEKLKVISQRGLNMWLVYQYGEPFELKEISDIPNPTRYHIIFYYDPYGFEGCGFFEHLKGREKLWGSVKEDDPFFVSYGTKVVKNLATNEPLNYTIKKLVIYYKNSYAYQLVKDDMEFYVSKLEEIISKLNSNQTVKSEYRSGQTSSILKNYGTYILILTIIVFLFFFFYLFHRWKK